MSKRAVRIVYGMIIDLITGNNVIEQQRVTSGIPKDAMLIDMFVVETPAVMPVIIVIFDSDKWDCPPLGIYVEHPKLGRIFEHPVSVEKRLHKQEYHKVLHAGIDVFKISSKTPISVTARKENRQHDYLECGSLSLNGEWVEIEELT